MNRKATFAKRQRESDLKDHARAKEARKAARKDTSRTGKGPEIAWDEAVYAATPEEDEVVLANVAPTPPASDDSAADAPRAAAPAADSPRPAPSLVPTDDSP